MSRLCRARLVAAVVAVLVPLAARAQQPTAPPTQPAAAPTPGAVPLPEVAHRGDDTIVYLKQLEERAAPGPDVAELERDLPIHAERIGGLRQRVKDVLAASPSIGAVDELLSQTQAAHDFLTARATALTANATVLEQEIQGLNDLRGVWRATKDAAEAAGAPPQVLERIKATSAAILATRKRIEANRETLLTLQDRTVQQAARARESIDELEAYRRTAVGRLLVPDAPPIWSPARWPGTWGDAFGLLRSQFNEGRGLLRDYAAQQLVRLPLQLALFVALFLLWRKAHERTARWLAEDATLGPIAVVFEHPAWAALFLTLITTPLVYPQAPLPLLYLVRIALVVPLMRILDRLVDRPLLPLFYALGGFFVVDQLRNVVGGVPLLEQTLFMLEMLAGTLILAWVLRSRRLHTFDPPLKPRTVTLLERSAWILFGLFVFALVAAALGFMQLSRVAAAAVLGAAYAALLFFALQRTAAGLWAFLLRTRTMRRLRAVDLNRALLQQRGERLLAGAATICWILASLDAAGLLRPLRKSLVKVLAATLTIGSFSISLRDVVAFAFTIWLSFVVSRFARFVLEEEVFPRVRLARGLPYALSNILHYVILLVGFLIALAASGLNLDRFALLAGAFGVGVGFGLQNVVNNFVSGLILLFERPVQVGDTVQIGAISGEVRRIGIRSSTLRVGDGAEVIVPNGTFIAETVTNWTLSDRLRRIDLPITIPYGHDPERVLELLRGVATGHQLVLKHPPPTALFTSVGDRLGFELRCWTDRFEQWSLIRSELSVALVKALVEAGIEVSSSASRDVKMVSGPVAVRVVREGKE